VVEEFESMLTQYYNKEQRKVQKCMTRKKEEKETALMKERGIMER